LAAATCTPPHAATLMMQASRRQQYGTNQCSSPFNVAADAALAGCKLVAAACLRQTAAGTPRRGSRCQLWLHPMVAGIAMLFFRTAAKHSASVSCIRQADCICRRRRRRRRRLHPQHVERRRASPFKSLPAMQKDRFEASEWTPSGWKAAWRAASQHSSCRLQSADGCAAGELAHPMQGTRGAAVLESQYETSSAAGTGVLARSEGHLSRVLGLRAQPHAAGTIQQHAGEAGSAGRRCQSVHTIE
jgi:hypothetical protein